MRYYIYNFININEVYLEKLFLTGLILFRVVIKIESGK
ncbi:hypothetical protein SAMN05216269_11848 [Flavobacterium xinjiangense]|uniref:Uncharacterized protein n=1 Tax=Flavobacterium xinjiangense TaxID=178356 RepID=A0A1M7PJC7_9FLAO|nr:hypothetical protein SAMN05216269_11848 [Flavobacterium xinjiangense]